MGSKLGKWVIKWRWPVVIVSLLFALASGYGGQFIGFNDSYRIFFGDDNPQLQSFDAIERIYSKNDNMLLVLAPKDGNIYTPKTLHLIKEITTDMWQVPYSTRVDSISNFQHTTANGDDLIVQDLVLDPEALTDADLAEIRRICENEPALLNRIISRKGHVTAVNITVNTPEGNPHAVQDIANYVREYVAEKEALHPEIDFYLSGVVMLNTAFSESSMNDMMTLTPLMYLVIIALMIVFLRSVSATIASVIVILLSAMTAMGLAGWAGVELAGPSAMAPTVILTLAIADSIHVLITFLQEMRRGSSKLDAIVESLRINMRPVFITSLTTVIGFLSLNFSDAPPLNDLGNITAVGVLAAYAYSVLFLPALMAILPVSVKVSDNPDGADNKKMLAFSDFVLRHQNGLFWGVAVTAVILIALIPTIRLNDKFVEYFEKGVDFRDHSDFVIRELTGMYAIDFSLKSPESGGASDPAFLKKVETFTQWLEKQPNTVHVSTFTDVMKRVNRSMHGDDEQWYRLPDSRELASQYLLLYELSLPYGLDLTNQLDIDKSSVRIVATLGDATSDDIRAYADAGTEWIKTNMPEYFHFEGTGPSVMFSHISKRNINAMIWGTAVAFILITVVLILSFRSLKYGFLSLFPNILPILMSLGVWALLVGWAGFGISVIASVTLGIVVDDSVHFMSKYIRARQENGLSGPDAIRYAFSTVGVALFTTSVILVIGFYILTLSPFLFNKHLGMLSLITIALALFADFLFLPALLLKVDRWLEGDKS